MKSYLVLGKNGERLRKAFEDIENGDTIIISAEQYETLMQQTEGE